MQTSDLTKKAEHYKAYKFIIAFIKVGKEILTFDNIKIFLKIIFFHFKSSIFLKNV